MAKTKTATRYRSRPAKRRRRKNGFTIPLAVMAPIGVVGATAISTGSLKDGANYITGALTGYRPDWKEKGWSPFHAERLKSGAFPILLGIFAHKVAGKLGVNRMLASSGVPFIRI